MRVVVAGGEQETNPRPPSPTSMPRNDWELEAPANLGAPFVSGTRYRTSTQTTIRGLLLLVVVAVVALGTAVSSGNPAATALGSLLLLVGLIGTGLMIRRAVRAEMRSEPRETLERRRLRR